MPKWTVKVRSPQPPVSQDDDGIRTATLDSESLAHAYAERMEAQGWAVLEVKETE